MTINTNLVDSGIEWMGKVPNNWQILPLFKYVQEKKQKNIGNRIDNVLSLSYGNIIRRDINDGGLQPESFETYQIVDIGDIILRLTDLQNDKRSLRVGRVTEQGIITSAYVCIKSKELDSKYLYYLLHAYDLLKVFYNLGGGLRQTMKFSDLKRLPVFNISLNEQRKIVDYLDKEISKIDKLTNKQQQLLKLLDEKRQSIVKHVISCGINEDISFKDSGSPALGKIPAHWNTKRLKYITKIKYGKSLAAEDRKNGEINVFGSNGIVDTHDKSNTLMPLLVIGRKGSYGKANFSKEPGFVIDTAFYIDSTCTNANIKWLYYLISSIDFEGQSLDTGVPGLSRELAYNQVVPSISLAEQESIVNYLDTKIEELNILENKIKKQIAIFTERKIAIISNIVTGKLII